MEMAKKAGRSIYAGKPEEQESAIEEAVNFFNGDTPGIFTLAGWSYTGKTSALKEIAQRAGLKIIPPGNISFYKVFSGTPINYDHVFNLFNIAIQRGVITEGDRLALAEFPSSAQDIYSALFHLCKEHGFSLCVDIVTTDRGDPKNWFDKELHNSRLGQVQELVKEHWSNLTHEAAPLSFSADRFVEGVLRLSGELGYTDLREVVGVLFGKEWMRNLMKAYEGGHFESRLRELSGKINPGIESK